MTEHGPVTPNTQGGLDYNPLSWTRFANIVYLEQPAFVGFSYSDDPLDHATDDAKAAKDNIAFVDGFLKQFPKYVGRDTYFAGERWGANAASKKMHCRLLTFAHRFCN